MLVRTGDKLELRDVTAGVAVQYASISQQMGQSVNYLKQSTATQHQPIGPFLDEDDGKTAETGLTIANTDIKLWKEGATSFANKNSGGAAYEDNGFYGITFDATDTNTVGKLKMQIHVAGALPVFETFYVLEEAIYDALFAGSAAGFSSSGEVTLLAATQASIDAVETDTSTTLQAELDAIQAAVITNAAGVDIAADIIAVKAETAAILADTAEIGTAGAGLTDVGGFSTAAKGQINTEADTALTDYDAPTRAELTTDTNSILTRLGTPAGADVSADVAAIQSDTNDIQLRLPSALTTGTADSGSTTTMVDAARTEADNDYWKGQLIRFTSGTATGQVRLITGFTAATDTITFEPATTQAITTNTYEILPFGRGDLLTATQASIDAIETDTADMQPKLGTPSADVSADIAAVKSDTAAVLVDTGTTLPATLGTPTGADMSADIAAVKADTAATLIDTAEIGAAGAGLTNLGGMSTAMKAEVNAEADTALTDYDPPTNAEMEARTLVAANYFDPAADTVANVTTVATTTTNTDMRGTDSAALADTMEGFFQVSLRSDAAITTDRAAILTLINANEGSGAGNYAATTESLEALRDRGDAAWITATGFSTLVATDIVSDGTALNTTAGVLDVVNLANTITTYTGNTVQTGDSYARLGAPAGASMAADVAAVKVDTAATLIDTGTTLPATLATIDGNVDAVLVDTGATLPATLATIDTNVDAILVDTATTLPATLAGLNNISAADVNAQVLDVINVDTLVDGKTIPAAMQIIAAVVAGKISGAGTGTEVFLGIDGVTTRATVTVDGSGNRSGVTY